MAAALIRIAGAADAFAAIYAPFVTDSAVSFEEIAPDAAEMARRIAGDGGGFHPWLAAEAAGRVIGYASSALFRTRPAYRWTVETGVYLAPLGAWRTVQVFSRDLAPRLNPPAELRRFADCA